MSIVDLRQEAPRIVGLGTARGYTPEALAVKDEITAILIAKGTDLEALRLRQGADPYEIAAELEAEGFRGWGLEQEALRLMQLRGLDRYHEAQSYNTLVNGGTNNMMLAITGGTITGGAYNNTNAALGVGDSSAAFAATQTNLQGAVNVTDRVRKAMNATYPSVSTNVATFQSTFGTSDANFTWNEWAIFNNVTDGSGTMLNRAVSNLGTKTSAASWQLTVTLTQS